MGLYYPSELLVESELQQNQSSGQTDEEWDKIPLDSCK